jgi:heptaprenyl diphosphate synthase
MRQPKSGSIALAGLLGALALALSFLEGLLPPLPGMPPGARLGLSNLATMYAAGCLGLPWALAVAVVKAGFGFLTRGLTAGLMSLCGGLVSASLMWLALTKTSAGLAVTGVWGALGHNLAQLGVACVLTSPAALAYGPFLLGYGLLTGLLTGTTLKLTLPPLQKLSRYLLRR